MYDKLVAKVNNIDTSRFVLKTEYGTDKAELQKKFLILLDLLEKQTTIIKLLKQKVKYQALVVQPKIDKILTDHNHGIYITTPEINKLTAENFPARLKHANLVTKTDFDDKLKNLHQRINLNITKHLRVENELKKVKTFNLSHFRGRNHFENDGTKNYLVFQPIYNYFRRTVKTNQVVEWKSRELADEHIKIPPASSNVFEPL